MSEETQSLEGIKYFFVDDEPELSDLKKDLVDDGAECKEFFQLDDVVGGDAFMVNPPTIVLDLMFPSNWRDGVNFLERLRSGKTSLPPSTPVVVFTCAGQDAMDQCYELGANFCYSKAFQLEDLENSLFELGHLTKFGKKSKWEYVSLSHDEKFQRSMKALHLRSESGQVGFLDLNDHFQPLEGVEENDSESQILIMTLFSFASKLSDWDFARIRPILCSKVFFSKRRRPPPWDGSSIQKFLSQNGKNGLRDIARWINREPSHE